MQSKHRLCHSEQSEEDNNPVQDKRSIYHSEHSEEDNNPVQDKRPLCHSERSEESSDKGNKDNKTNRTLIIIPAYNEGENLPGLFESLKNAEGDYDILVINDCSQDNTEAVCIRNGIKVISLPVNLGIGGAVQTGYIYALNHGYDIAIQLDGDGQHDPAFIPSMIKLIEEGCNLCIGSRFIENEGFKSTRIRRAGIKYFSWLIWFVTGFKITDPTSGFRACSREVIRLFAGNYPKDYPEPETVVTVLKNRLKVCEIPVIMNAREGGTSSITRIKGLYYMIKVTLAIIIASISGRSVVKVCDEQHTENGSCHRLDTVFYLYSKHGKDKEAGT
jgi:glycosyltransferase involved in cell wall biosynthesis